MSVHEQGLYLHVNRACTHEQGLRPRDRKLSGGMFVAMSGNLFEFSEVSGVTGRRASSVVSG